MSKAASQDPGSVLKALIAEYQINPSRLASAVNLSQSTIRQIILNKMKISVPTALRFAKFFGNPVEFWIELQLNRELAEALADKKLTAVLSGIKKAQKPASPKIKAGKKPAAPKAPRKTKPAKAGRPKKSAASGTKKPVRSRKSS